jgi:hypothetical protein
MVGQNGNRGQSPLPVSNPDADNGNNIGALASPPGSGRTLAPGNPVNGNPRRGGTTLPRGQAGTYNPPRN